MSESGLFHRADLDRVQAAGAQAVLVGEALMRQADVEAALQSLIMVEREVVMFDQHQHL